MILYIIEDKKILFAFVIFASFLNAQAIEQYEPQLPEATEGVAAGMLPPPELYKHSFYIYFLH